MGALAGEQMRDLRRIGEQPKNLFFEHPIGIGHPLVLVHQLEPGFDQECLEETPSVHRVL